MKQLKWHILLHILLMIYALSSVFGKLAAQEDMFSPKFILFYGGMIALLGVYALFWQQVIKHMKLTTAYAAKAMTVLWGFVFGVVLFNETITPGKIFGLGLIVAGIVLFAVTDAKEEEEKQS
ncbi:MAG: transporter [Solobacterium sp.]|nr:transporter [Solobacterium sp.]